MHGCFDLVRLLQPGLIPVSHAMATLDVLFAFSGAGVEAAMRDIGVRVVATLVSDAEVNAELRKFLQMIGRKGRTKISKSLLDGLDNVVQRGSAVQRKAAVTLAASLVGRWLPAPVLAILFASAKQDPAEANRAVAVEAVSFLLDEMCKDPNPEAAAAFALSTQEVLCGIAARDGNADVRSAALDALHPREAADPLQLSHEAARAVCERLADRSAKARARAAACLGAWGTARLLRVLTVADWQHLVKWGLAPKQIRKVTTPVNALVLELLKGPDALQWLRRLNLLHSPQHELLLRANATQIFPRLLSGSGGSEPEPMEVELGGSDD